MTLKLQAARENGPASTGTASRNATLQLTYRPIGRSKELEVRAVDGLKACDGLVDHILDRDV